MDKSKTHLAILLIAALVPLAKSPSALANSNCAAPDASVTFASTLSLPPVSTTVFEPVRMAISRNQFEQAETLLREAPPGPEQALWRGILLLHTGKTFASIRSLEEASRLHDSSTIETLLAVDYLLLNQRQLAGESISKAMALNPKDERTMYIRGRFHFLTHAFAKSAEDFRSVLQTEPADYRSLFYLGSSEWRLGETSQALIHLHRSIDVVSCGQIGFALAPRTLAELELQTGNLNGSLAHTDLALGMAAQTKDQDNDEVATILLLRGKVEFALGKKQAAEDDWRHALSLNAASAECWYLLARLYRQRGETGLADEALSQYHRIRDEL